MKDNTLLIIPRRLSNCDETFLPLDYSYSGESSHCQRDESSLQSNSRYDSLLCCASAAGIPHPPMIIYSNCFPVGPYRLDGPDDALYAKSDSGLVDSELFLTWLKKRFLK